MQKFVIALALIVAAPAFAGDLAPPTVKKSTESYVVTFHVEKFPDIGDRFRDHVNLAKEALGSTSSVRSTVVPRSDRGFDVTYDISK